jgi:serine/threonine protein kinase
MTRYELLERIGVGGMAEIYRGRATAVGGFEKPVAIKKILPHLGRDDRFVQMLIAEAKLLSSLRHRNIVNIYDVGLGEDGEYFLVMEFVDGRDLGTLYEQMEQQAKRFPQDLALYIGSEVCDALDHAHRATGEDGRALGIVHRDVSPSNVLLSHAGEVKLTDFGIAKPADERSVVATIKGKFAYMSPEQAWARPLDQTSDLFSLGIVLYELLLGKRLFSHQNEFEALRGVREGRVPRPRDVDPSFSRELEGILLKSLAHDPRKRYPNANAMGAALRDFRYSSATSAGDPAKEIAKLIRTFFTSRDAAKTQRGSVVRIKTVAGFPSRHGLEGEFNDEAPTRAKRVGTDDPLAHFLDAAPLDLRQPTSDDEAQTRLLETKRLRNGNGSSHAPAAASAAAAAPAVAAATLTMRGSSVLSGAPLSIETPPPDPKRVLAKGREATPTVRDAFPRAFTDPPPAAQPVETAQVAPVPIVDPQPPRRRALWWILLLTLVAAAGGGVAFVLRSQSGDDADGNTVVPSTRAGEALDTPTIKAPIRRK